MEFQTTNRLTRRDIVSVDCGVYMNDFYGDHAYTFAVGEIDAETEKLLRITKRINVQRN